MSDISNVNIHDETQKSRTQGAPLISTDPATNAIVWEGYCATDTQVAEAVAAARSAQTTWQALGLEARKNIAQRFADELRTSKNQLAEIICRETGKPHWEALAEVDAMIGKIAISIDAQKQRAGSQHNTENVLCWSKLHLIDCKE